MRTEIINTTEDIKVGDIITEQGQVIYDERLGREIEIGGIKVLRESNFDEWVAHCEARNIPANKKILNVKGIRYFEVEILD